LVDYTVKISVYSGIIFIMKMFHKLKSNGKQASYKITMHTPVRYNPAIQSLISFANSNMSISSLADLR